METKKSILKKYYGYDEFREGQEYLIDSILNNKNVIGVMPTGAGKSICFQVPALLLDGITIVISPLISLMKDQVDALIQAGVKAAYINSSLTQTQCAKVTQNAREGKYKIIYVAPERLLTDDFLSLANDINISMVTIDEAHCISQWGQDFRPSYTKISEFISRLNYTPVVSAFTATATEKVRDDITLQLNLVNPTILVTGFDRDNLFFAVEKPSSKKISLVNFLEEKNGQFGIVYCSTRKEVEKVCDLLKEKGFLASAYHAGLSDVERSKSQDDFLFDRVNIIVATNAFGMGIDKSNVTYVVHYNMPKNMESYYQEAGRAGRDGSPSICMLYYGGNDVRTNMFLIENGQDKDHLDKQTAELIREADRERLKQMTFYCHTTECLREYILKYFGETPKNYCGNCGNCNDNFETKDITIDAQKILSCVVRLKERFGIKMVIDVLRGSKIEKIMRLGFDSLSTFGILNISENNIRGIINFLVLNNFLFITSDEYPVLKLGIRSNEILKDRINLEMKLSTKEYTHKEKAKKADKKLKNVNDELFGILKEVRIKIANEQKVPAFVIFSDSTLVDMCMKLPKNEKEFLDVSGVGDVKLNKYGAKFIDAIVEFSGTHDDIKDLSEDSITEIQISDKDVSIGILADAISCQLIQKKMKKITAKTINDWLLKENYIKNVKSKDGNPFVTTTEKGVKFGLVLHEKTSDQGLKYYVINSSKKSSKSIVELRDCFLK